MKSSRRSPGRLAGVLLAVLVLAAATAGAGEVSLPEKLHAVYEVRYAGAAVGDTEWRIEPSAAGEYRFSSRTKPEGLFALLRDEQVVEQSTWRLDDAGAVQPLAYRHQRIGGKRARDLKYTFDWSTRQLLLDRDGERSTQPLEAPTLDALSYVLALMRDVAGGADRFEYRVLDGTKIKTYTLERRGEEALSVPLGRYDTIKVVRIGMDDGRETTLWLAPQLGFLPVRISHREREGYRIDVVLARLDPEAG